MFRSKFAQFLLGLCLVTGSGLLSGCSADASPQEEAAETGTLNMPLLTTAGAHSYRLEGGFYVSGPVFSFYDLNGDVVSASLPTGSYQATLYSWQLTRDDGTGNFRPVMASLVSTPNPSFTIFNGTTSTLSFQFETDSLLVTVGAGSLKVDVDVHETPPVCTPFGNDCAAGTWCAPPALTGMSATCIAEGPQAEGETCGSPLDCVANTSCFDWGAGARCVPLCSSAELDAPCSSGGTCTAQGGADYGVCVPAL